MLTVYKYPFDIKDVVIVAMPAGAQVLHIGMQNGTPCLWALVDTDSPIVQRTFYVRGTGHPVQDSLWHVGSFLMAGGHLVWHVFALPGK